MRSESGFLPHLFYYPSNECPLHLSWYYIFKAETETSRRRNGRGAGATKVSTRGRGAGGRGGRRQSPAPVAQAPAPVAQSPDNAATNHLNATENSIASANLKADVTSNGNSNTVTNGAISQKSEDWGPSSTSNQTNQVMHARRPHYLITHFIRLTNEIIFHFCHNFKSSHSS